MKKFLSSTCCLGVFGSLAASSVVQAEDGKYPKFEDIRLEDERYCLDEPCDKVGNFYLSGSEVKIEAPAFVCRLMDGEKKPRIYFRGSYVESKGGSIKDFSYLKELDKYLSEFAKKKLGYANYHVSANEALFC